MPEANFRSLQTLHESLLQKQQKASEENQHEFTREVREFIEQAKRGGSNISSTRERDQVRANLRYWANYIYSVDRTFPDTELAPSTIGGQRFPATIIGILAILVIAVLAGAGRLLFRGGTSASSETETPFSTPTLVTEATQTFEPVLATETATPESTGFNVILSSPANGDFITPNAEFKGTFDNIKPGWAVHVLFINGGKYFPVKENYPIPEKPASNEWIIQTRLTESPDELSQAKSYSIVLAVSIDDKTREFLSNSSEEGIEIKSLPAAALLFDDTARVIYRDPFTVVQETRLVYSSYNGKTYDIYTSKPDGSDIRQITFTEDISELSPHLSPNGTKIVYIKHPAPGYAIYIMDSNAQNDHEVLNRGENVIENPQWSPDSSYISYAMGDTSQSPTYWSIHVYNLLTKEDKIISGESEALAHRYSSWIPNKNIVVFDARFGNRSRFIQVSIDTPEIFSEFSDPEEEVIQPNIEILGDGYLLTYTVVNADFSHDIYAVLDLDGQLPFGGSPVRLTKSRGGTDFPTLGPNSKVIYYVREGTIYKVEFNTEGNNITLISGANTDDGESFGDQVIGTGQVNINLDFDIGNMDTFFPIQ